MINITVTEPARTELQRVLKASLSKSVRLINTGFG